MLARSMRKNPTSYFKKIGLKLRLLGWCHGSLCSGEHKSQCTANLRAIVDDLRSQGVAALVARGIQNLRLGYYFGCKREAEGDGGSSRTVQAYPASRSRVAMRAATRSGSSLNVRSSGEMATL